MLSKVTSLWIGLWFYGKRFNAKPNSIAAGVRLLVRENPLCPRHPNSIKTKCSKKLKSEADL